MPTLPGTNVTAEPRPSASPAAFLGARARPLWKSLVPTTLSSLTASFQHRTNPKGQMCPPDPSHSLPCFCIDPLLCLLPPAASLCPALSEPPLLGLIQGSSLASTLPFVLQDFETAGVPLPSFPRQVRESGVFTLSWSPSR